MKRPLATIGFTYLIALALAYSFGINFSVVSAIAFFAASIYCIANKNIRSGRVFPIAAISACLAFSLFSVYTFQKIQPVKSLFECETYISGTAVNDSSGDDYVILDVNSVDLDSVPQTFRMLVYTNDIGVIEKYNTLEIKVHFYEIPKKYLKYEQSRGVLIYGYQVLDSPVSLDMTTGNKFLISVREFRNSLIKSIDRILPLEISSILRAVLTGDKSAVPDNIKTAFSKTGTSHLLAVSGLHTMLLCAAVIGLLKILRIPRRLRSFTAAVFVLLFMLLTGFPASVVRAGIMAIVMLLGSFFGRQSDSLNSMGLACIVICLQNPYSSMDIGFQLSVTATLGLIVLTPKINRISEKSINKIKNKPLKYIVSFISSSFSQTIGATVFTAPILLMTYGSVSTVALFANLIIIQAFALFLPVGAIAALIDMTGVFSFFARPFALVSFLIGKYIIFVAEKLASLPFALTNVNSEYILLWICSVMLIFTAAYALRKNGSLFKLAAVLSLAVILCGAASYHLLNYNVTEVSIGDVGDDCSVMIKNGDSSVIIGSGDCDFDSLNDIFFEDNAGRVNALIIGQTFDFNDNNASRAIYKYKPRSIFLKKPVEIEEAFLNDFGVPVYRLGTGSIKPWKNSEILIFSDIESKDWIIFKDRDFKLLICPLGGDVKNLPQNERNPDVSVVFSADITNLKDLNCNTFIISAQRKTAARIEQVLVSQDKKNIFSTSDNGNVDLTTRGNGYVKIKRS